MKFNNSPIGIFDSGLGGLTVFKEIRKILPFEDLIYFGDTARVPYGNKSKETIIKYSSEILGFLTDKKIKIAIVACNTSSSLALDYLRKISPVPVFGVIEPGAQKAVEVSLKISGRKIIAVIGTSATVKSGAYSKTIKEKAGLLYGIKKVETANVSNIDFNENLKIIEKSCPLFVPLVEEGFLSEEITKNIIKYYLASVVKEEPACLVLGCTHYPILKDFIEKEIGENTEIIDSGVETARSVKNYLEEFGMLKSGTEFGSETFFVSDDSERFKELGGKFLGRSIDNVYVVNFS
ncbi:MAG: glutamate racemase [Deltaproteobacteria bacterium]|jgi:glutamate racemase|nr:glutamate racemase [Deltaproteobacteria bacterium]